MKESILPVDNFVVINKTIINTDTTNPLYPQASIKNQNILTKSIISGLI